MNTLHRAKLIAHDFDGIPLMRDDIPLGKEYIVDVASKQKILAFNSTVNKHYTFEWISTYKVNGQLDGGLLPTCILEIEEGVYEVAKT